MAFQAGAAPTIHPTSNGSPPSTLSPVPDVTSPTSDFHHGSMSVSFMASSPFDAPYNPEKYNNVLSNDSNYSTHSLESLPTSPSTTLQFNSSDFSMFDQVSASGPITVDNHTYNATLFNTSDSSQLMADQDGTDGLFDEVALSGEFADPYDLSLFDVCCRFDTRSV